MSFDQFQTANRLRYINRSAQVILGFTLLLCIGYLSSHHFKRWDIAKNNRYTLSPETLAYVDKINEPVTIYVTLSPHSKESELQSLYQDIKELLREYKFYANHRGEDKIRVEFIDTLISRQKAESLAAHYQIPIDNLILVTRADRFETVSLSDLYKSEAGEIVAFNGEQAITSALLRLIQEKTPLCYFLTGHGELDLDEVQPMRGLSELQLFLKTRGLESKKLDIGHQSIPDDADLLVIVGPQAPYLSEEIDKLNRYLDEKNGHLIVLLSPQQRHGLDPLFYNWGLLADKAAVIDTAPNARLSNGDLLIRRFADHPITNPLINYQVTVLTGLAGPIRQDPAALPDKQRIITPLMASSEQSWAERMPHADALSMTYDPLRGDMPGPVSLACAVEKKTGGSLGLNIQGGRLVVFGTSDWVTNHRLGLLGNHLLFWNACVWALGRPSLPTVFPRPLGHYQLPISSEELIRLAGCLCIPAFFISLMGLIVYFIRRR